jgi:hypothetical protein
MSKSIAELREDHASHAEQRQHTLDYHRDYNKEHMEDLKKSKKDKYATDPVFREAAKKRSKDRYALQKKIRQEIRKTTGFQATPARRRGSASQLYCPTCLQPVPRPLKPIFKSVQRKYLVAMFTVRELARRLGKQVPTVIKWIRNERWLPETMYKEQRTGTSPSRLWTQDQVEMLMRVFDKYDMRPPANYETIGLVKEVRAEWDKLRPTGIDSKLYVLKDEETGLLARESYELPMPKFASRSELSYQQKLKEKKIAEENG